MAKWEYSTYTDDETMTDTLIWTVPKFLDFLNNESKKELRMEKPEDAAAESSAPRFQIKLRLSGRNNDIIEIYYLSLIRLILKAKITIHHQSFSKAYYGGYDERELKTKENYIIKVNQWEHFYTLSKNNIDENKNIFLMNSNRDERYGSLRLAIEFTTFHTKYNINIENVDESNVTETRLTHAFEHLLANGFFSDVTMKSIEGNEYKVHKAVLASRSVVLKSFFEHNTIECQTNIIESHFEAEVLTEVLMFIYTDKAQRVDEIPEKLLAAANFYQLSRLKSLCVEALSKRLTAENAIETLELANLYSAENLNQLVLEFIKEGQARQIIKTEGWTKLNSVDLLKKIFEIYIKADD